MSFCLVFGRILWNIPKFPIMPVNFLGPGPPEKTIMPKSPSMVGLLSIHIADHLLDLFFLGLEAERAHRDLQLLCINVAAAIGVEEIEGLLDLLLPERVLDRVSSCF